MPTSAERWQTRLRLPATLVTLRPAIAVELRVNHRRHGGLVEGSAEEEVDGPGGLLRVRDRAVVADVEHLEVRALANQNPDRCEVAAIGIGHRLTLVDRGLTAAVEHLVLRCDQLIEIATHEHHAVEIVD